MSNRVKQVMMKYRPRPLEKLLVLVAFLCSYNSYALAQGDPPKIDATRIAENTVDSVLLDTLKYPIREGVDTTVFVDVDTAMARIRNALDSAVTQKDTSLAQVLRAELGMLETYSGNYLAALNLFEETMDYFMADSQVMEAGLMQVFIADIYNLSTEIDVSSEPFVKYASELIGPVASDSYAAEILRNTRGAMLRNGIKFSFEDSDSLKTEGSNIPNVPGYDGQTLLNYGMYQLDHGNTEKAEFYLLSVLQADPVDGVLLRDTYRVLARLYRTTGKLEPAYTYLHLYSNLNESLLNERRQRLLNDLVVERQLNEKEAEIRDLRKDQYIERVKNRGKQIANISLLIGSVIILFSTYLTIRNYQKRINAREIIHKQKEEINRQKITDLENNLKIKTMQSMIQGQEAERERVAKDLHDSLGGLLSTVKLHFDALQSQMNGVDKSREYQKAYSLLDEACNEVRSISNNMQPGALLKLGLVPAISDLIHRLVSDETPEISFQHFGINGQITQTISLNIYRIVQELLNNSLKHARANHILVQLIQEDEDLMVMVEDDGVGYDTENVSKGMGTENIRSRVDYLKGEISIQSNPGDGTTTLITIPLEKQEAIKA